MENCLSLFYVILLFFFIRDLLNILYHMVIIFFTFCNYFDL